MPQIVIYLYDLKKDPTQKCAIYTYIECAYCLGIYPQLVESRRV